MLRNRREFLKYVDKMLKSPINSQGPITEDDWNSLVDKIKKGLPTCPIVCLSGFVLEKVNLRMQAQEEENTPDLQELLNTIENEHKRQVDKLNGFVNMLKSEVVSTGEDETREAIKDAYNYTIRKAESDKQETISLLKEILNNPIDYETRGMPFNMLMVLATDYPDEPLLGLLLVELDPENWSVFQINKRVNKTLISTKQEVVASGYKCEANSNYIKTLDYLLNQRNNIVEVEPTSMGIGQHITILPRKTRQLPKHIIYIGTKKKFLKDYPQQASRLMRKPVFAHMVRGHWRKLHGKQTKGKDRSGKIIFNGYTWVIPHKRGEGEITDNTVYAIKGE